MNKSNNTGIKYDKNKPPLALLSKDFLEEVAKVLEFGANKYNADNWRGGMEWRRVISAAMRHIVSFSDGEDLDPETGLLHTAHAACCLMFLIEYYTKELGKDDRYKRGLK